MTEFNKYFEDTFLIEGGYDGKEIDKSFRFDQNNKHATPKDVFDVIKQAFEDGQDMDKVEAFMRKLDIIGKDMVDNTFNYPDSNFYESLQSSSFEVSGQVIEIPHYLTDTGKLRTDSLQELCDQSNVPSKINFRNVVFVINNKTFEELYEIMNATAINFDKGIRFRNFFRESGMEQECKESEIRRKNEALDIIAPIKHDMGNGRYYINTRLRDEMAEIIKKAVISKNLVKLSKASLETLAIIAYNQPITKVQIDKIRGVSSDSILHSLVSKELIVSNKTLDTIGKPKLYETTDIFLDVFGLESLEQLPKSEIVTSEEINKFLQN